jgi:hypothetical protein
MRVGASVVISCVADAGPLQWGKKRSEKLFKPDGTLIPADILFASVFSVASALR